MFLQKSSISCKLIHGMAYTPKIRFTKGNVDLPSNVTRRITCREALNMALDEEIERDENVFLMGIKTLINVNRRGSRLILRCL